MSTRRGLVRLPTGITGMDKPTAHPLRRHWRGKLWDGLRGGALALLLITGTCGRSDAALLAYEGFNYTPGTSIGGQSGGSFWPGSWASGAASFMLGTNNATGLTYTDQGGRTLLTSGGSLVVGNPFGPTSTQAFPNRAMSNNLSGGTGTTAGPGGTYWISLLYKRLNLEAGGAPYFLQANLGLCQGLSEQLAVGGPNTSATVSNVFSVWGNGAPHSASAPFQSPAHPLLPDTTTFILIKVVTDGTTAPDAAYVWFDLPDLTSEPANASAHIIDTEVNLSSVNTLWLRAAAFNANGTNAAFQVDELRVGTTFADVTPNAANAEAPAILDEPDDLTVIAGQPAAFSVTAAGSPPLSYQWYFNSNTPLADATNATYSIPSTAPGHAGGYSAVVTNSAGAVTSAVAVLTVEMPAAPEITAHPQDRTNVVGATATFSATATGTAPLRYQWYYNTNTPLANQTNPALNLLINSITNSGTYSVTVTNNYGAVTSGVARLTVFPPLPAFPGADGAAGYVSGGRGGIVYRVTRLNSQLDDPQRNSPGTFWYGLNNANFPPGVPRTIVFDVAGVFHMGLRDTATWTSGGNAWDGGSRIGISASNITIAGQTAPGPVIFMGGSLKPQGSNQVYRNITVAAGYGMRLFWEPNGSAPAPPALPTAFTMDAIDISGQNIMIDHVDALYATDEAVSCNEVANNVTIQYGNNSIAQNYNGHAYGHLLQAGTDHKISLLHNLDAHMKSRLPRVGSEVGLGALNDFRNNLFYNWLGNSPGYAGTAQYSKNNFIHNFYLAGNGGDSSWQSTEGGGTGIFNGASASYTAVYPGGNVRDTNKDGDPNDAVSADGNYSNSNIRPNAYDIAIGVTLSARDAFTNVLRYAGSRWWERDYDFALGNTAAIDSIDERIIHEVVTGTGRIRAWADDPYNNDPSEGVEWRSLWALRMDTNGAAPFNRPANWDTDLDGMPDCWEIRHGLNPSAPNNNADFDNDFYTDLEEYLNEIAAWPAPGAIQFTGEQNNRYAAIYNWRVYGVPVNIAGIGNVPTSSQWQPSRFDTAIVSNAAVVVDAVGQHARTLRLTNNATVNITAGWLKIRDLDIAPGCGLTIAPGGTLRMTGAGSINLSPGATFTNAGVLDIIRWNGTLPAGLVNAGIVLDRNSLKLNSPQWNGPALEVSIHGYSGHEYQLQACGDLQTGTWQNVGPRVCGANTLITFSDSAGTQQRFYRVVVEGCGD